MRSPTAADIAAQWPGVKTDFAGLSADADEQLSREQIEWADELFVMEARHKKRVSTLFGPALKDKKVRILGIPDKFGYMEPALVELLRLRLKAFRG